MFLAGAAPRPSAGASARKCTPTPKQIQTGTQRYCPAAASTAVPAPSTTTSRPTILRSLRRMPGLLIRRTWPADRLVKTIPATAREATSAIPKPRAAPSQPGAPACPQPNQPSAKNPSTATRTPRSCPAKNRPASPTHPSCSQPSRRADRQPALAGSADRQGDLVLAGDRLTADGKRSTLVPSRRKRLTMPLGKGQSSAA